MYLQSQESVLTCLPQLHRIKVCWNFSKPGKPDTSCSPKEGIPNGLSLPAEQGAGREQRPRDAFHVYLPFSTSDLHNWKTQTIPVSATLQALINLLELFPLPISSHRMIINSHWVPFLPPRREIKSWLKAGSLQQVQG